MITTRLQDGALLYLYHRVRGLIDEEDVRAGLVDANEVIKSAVYEFDSMPLVIDMRDHRFASVEAHRRWHKGLREDEFIVKHIEKTAIVANDTAAFRAEIAGFLEEKGLSVDSNDSSGPGQGDGDTRFFTSLEEARSWLRTLN